MIRILVDTSADYTRDELSAKNLEVVPLGITIDEGQPVRDELDLTRGELYTALIEKHQYAKTSQPSPEDFRQAFQRIRDRGDEVICILLSSALSGTCQSAMLAREMVGEEGIYIVDSLTATVAIRILADYALQLAAEGVSAPEIVTRLNALKSRVKIAAAVDTLKYLYLGGRISKTTSIIADAVNIKPGITITTEGTVAVTGKHLGVNRAIKDIVKQLSTASLDPAFPLYVIYSYNRDNCLHLEKSLVAAGITHNGMLELGAALGVHIGPGAYGAVYVQAEEAR